MKLVDPKNYSNLLQLYKSGFDDNKSLERLIYLLMARNGANYSKPKLKDVKEAYSEVVEDKHLQELVDKSENWDVDKDGDFDKLNKEFNDVITEKNADESDYQEFTGPNDSKTCEECKKMLGKIICISGKDKRFMSYADFLKKHPLHFNCRHVLLPIDKEKVTEKQAMNTEEFNDKYFYTGFCSDENDYNEIPEDMKNILKPQDYNFDLDTYVLLSPYGNYYGYSNEDKTSVEEIVDEDACLNLANNFNDEVLVDIDHGSCKPPESRDSRAAGWVTSIKNVNNLGNLNGIYANIRWTNEGKKLVLDKTYRYLSPVWSLDDNNRPIKLISVALTNKPAIKTGKPIINTQPTLENDMSKEEIIELIKQTVLDIEKSKEEQDKQEEIKEEKMAVEEVANEEPAKTEEIKTEIKEEKDPEAKKPEVIKEEVLNTEAKPEIQTWQEKAMQLHGQEFFDYLKKNM